LPPSIGGWLQQEGGKEENIIVKLTEIISDVKKELAKQEAYLTIIYRKPWAVVVFINPITIDKSILYSII